MNQKVKILNYLILVLLITPYLGASKIKPHMLKQFIWAQVAFGGLKRVMN